MYTAHKRTLVREVQPSKVLTPIVVTLLGIVTLMRLSQPPNVPSPIVVTLSGIVYSVTPQPIAKEFSTPSIIRQRPLSAANLPLNSLRLEQEQNTSFSIVVTLSGIVTLVRLSQPSYLQPIITQYFIDNKSEIWLLFLIAHSKR